MFLLRADWSVHTCICLVDVMVKQGLKAFKEQIATCLMWLLKPPEEAENISIQMKWTQIFVVKSLESHFLWQGNGTGFVNHRAAPRFVWDS